MFRLLINSLHKCYTRYGLTVTAAALHGDDDPGAARNPPRRRRAASTRSPWASPREDLPAKDFFAKGRHVDVAEGLGVMLRGAPQGEVGRHCSNLEGREFVPRALVLTRRRETGFNY